MGIVFEETGANGGGGDAGVVAAQVGVVEGGFLLGEADGKDSGGFRANATVCN